jgi:hypothetical protein
MKSMEELNKICCPEFEPAKWQDKLFDWDDKMFIKDRVCTFFYIPLNFGRRMIRIHEKIKKAEANVPDWICLSDYTSKWNMDLYLAADREIPGTENTTISGHFFSKVYEGPYRDTKKWSDDFEMQTKSMGLVVKKRFIWYTTCPRCAKKYGKNYVVIIATVE